MATADADGARPEWTEPFARTIDAARKYVVSGLSRQVDLELVSRLEFGSGAAVAMRYEPRSHPAPDLP
ncbi:hypothetical protein [Nocardioides sp. W7]|uniref:hypothetical protein n=1 Tax=Nocardioides sp. W7 TaxID=2931390 RepID=UPI001FD33F59|nr:hypothetical protein [Nocardioides sp. W7]